MAREDAVRAVGYLLEELGRRRAMDGEARQEGAAHEGTRIVEEAEQRLFLG